MPLRSHLDPVLLLPVLHVRDDAAFRALPPEVREETDAARRFAEWRRTSTGRGVIFHETYHFWQGLRLPFMQWYSTFTLKVLAINFNEIRRRGPPDPKKWRGIGSIPGLRQLNEPSYFIAVRAGDEIEGFTELEPPTNGEDESGDVIKLSALDLLEAATSMAQWRVTATKSFAEMRDYRAYSRWCKRNPAYTNAFEVAINLLGDRELAFRCFISVICASFETSNPVKTFILLLVILKNEKGPWFAKFKEQQEPCKWPEAFDFLLEQIPFTAPPDSAFFEAFASGVDEAYCRLTSNHWSSIDI